MELYEMTIGPEGYLPPSVSERGVIGPSKGEGLVMGKRVPEQQAIDEAARRLIQAKNPTIFPGPLVLWAWNERAARESKVVKALAEAVPARLIPMADYRPKYPKIVAEREINPKPSESDDLEEQDRCLSLRRGPLSSIEHRAQDHSRRYTTVLPLHSVPSAVTTRHTSRYAT